MRFYFLPSPQNSLIRGILTLAVGIALLSLPGLTLKTVVMSVGGVILLSGLLSILLGTLKRKNGVARNSLQGFFNIIWGLLFLIYPMSIVKIFGFFFGILFSLLGFTQFFGAIGNLSKSIWSWIYLAFALILIAGGSFLLFQPIESAENILTFFGAILLVYSLMELTMAWRLKRIPKGTDAGNIVDTTYEEL